MLKELRFVQGAVAKKDFIPAMTHFAIEDGIVRSFNGVVALSSPLDFDIDCKPKAVQLVKAISNCKDTVSLSMTETGRLAVRSGPFRAYIDCVHEETPHVYPEGKYVPIDSDDLLEGFRRLEPFIGNDASRAWTNGILLKGQSAFATNNVMLVEYWMGTPFPYIVNVPKMAIVEALRVGEPCTAIQIAERSMTFHFADKKWIRTALLNVGWPDVESILNKKSDNLVEIPDSFYDALDAIASFTDKHGRVYINNEVVSTAPPEAKDEGAFFDVQGFPFNGIYRREMLMLMKGIVKKCDLSFYPDPCIFYGEKLRGAIIGMKM